MERFKPFNKETVLDTLEVEYYPQFAYANLNEQSRIEAITNVKVYVNNKYDILL